MTGLLKNFTDSVAVTGTGGIVAGFCYSAFAVAAMTATSLTAQTLGAPDAVAAGLGLAGAAGSLLMTMNKSLEYGMSAAENISERIKADQNKLMLGIGFIPAAGGACLGFKAALRSSSGINDALNMGSLAPWAEKLITWSQTIN